MNTINIENAMYMWFEMKFKTFDKQEDNESIYLYYKGEKIETGADIFIRKNTNYAYYKWSVWNEFESVFLVNQKVFETIMCKWIERVFKLKGIKSMVYE